MILPFFLGYLKFYGSNSPPEGDETFVSAVCDCEFFDAYFYREKIFRSGDADKKLDSEESG